MGLRALTESILASAKGKQVRTAFGVMKLTHSPGRVEIVDTDKALAWAEDRCPEAIQVKKSVLVSKVKESADFGVGLPTAAFRVTPPSTGFKVETGVGKEAEVE